MVDRAGRLTRDEVVRLDLAERRTGDVALTAYDLMRDRLAAGDVREQRFEARNAAWDAVASSLLAMGLEPAANDGYWRVARVVGAGAQRAARFAACAEVAPELLDDEVRDVLLRAWTRVIR